MKKAPVLNTIAKDCTHSVWTGKKYDKPKTHAEILAESMAILRRHPTLGKLVR